MITSMERVLVASIMVILYRASHITRVETNMAKMEYVRPLDPYFYFLAKKIELDGTVTIYEVRGYHEYGKKTKILK